MLIGIIYVRKVQIQPIYKRESKTRIAIIPRHGSKPWHDEPIVWNWNHQLHTTWKSTYSHGVPSIPATAYNKIIEAKALPSLQEHKLKKCWTYTWHPRAFIISWFLFYHKIAWTSWGLRRLYIRCIKSSCITQVMLERMGSYSLGIPSYIVHHL